MNKFQSFTLPIAVAGFPFLLSLSACGVITQHPKVAAVAKPAVVIATQDKKQVVNKLAEQCDRENFQIDSQEESSIVCSRESSIMAQALFGTKAGTNVRSNIRFSVFTVGSGVKATGTAWFGNQTAFGQNNTTSMENGQTPPIVQQMLTNAKAEIEAKSQTKPQTQQ
jgi:hypothetical protein